MIGVKNKNCRGVTLLEIMIAISVFSIVITAAIGLFTSLIKNQRELMDRAYVLNTISYSTEYMAKAIRMAQKDISGGCVGKGKNYLVTGESSIKFLNYNNECQEFFLESKTLKVRKSSVAHSLTPSNINIEGLKFLVLGESQSDLLQPKVTFTLKAKPATSTSPAFAIQTTISQRMLDIVY